jgi:ferredoxin-NADP reductase
MENTSEQVLPTEDYFIPDPSKSALLLIEKDESDMFELELMDKIMVSHDTQKFVFKLPQDDWVMGLPVGGHVFFHLPIEDGFISRKYTPVSPVNLRGKVEFVIKIYKPNEEFTAGGKMS